MIRTPALERLVGARGAGAGSAERCELCGVELDAVHRHLLDEDDELVCACTACSLLLERPGAAVGRYRPVPRRRLRIGGGPPPVEIPVGLAFFTKHDGRIVAHYPSPMGATKWELAVARWDAFASSHPEVAAIEPDVEAILVNTARGARECWLVPIDDCYRLVGIVKREWRGLSGGPAWQAVERFFAGLAGQSRSEEQGGGEAHG